MNIIEVLKKIDTNEIKEGTIFHGGDLFYNLIVIEKKLYVINTITKELSLLASNIIGNFIVKDYKLYVYKKIVD